MKRHPLARALVWALVLAIALASTALAEPASAGLRRNSGAVVTAAGRNKRKHKKPSAAPAALTRTYVREDYPQLTDAEYANFRAVATTDMGENVLYRSSSPINPKLGRSEQAAAALQAAGVRTVLNLADTKRNMRRYDGYAQSHYAMLDVLPLHLSVDFTSDDYREGLAEALRFLIDHDGPYLIHCTEGKDRTGFAVAILECLMGATAEEVVADYMVSYYNYYGVRPGTKQYDAIVKANIARDLAAAFGVKSATSKKVSLSTCAAVYLTELGLSLGEVEALKARLAGN